VTSLEDDGEHLSLEDLLAWAATRVFCLLNGRDLDLGVDEAERLVVAVAAGEIDVPVLAEALDRHLVEATR
jgi:death-on-curing protein